jgi:hypothetical protein
MALNGNQSLEQILESAIVVSWADLMRGTETGLIHIEYGFAPGGTLDYLKVWSSLTRGHWLLACKYWMSPSTLHGTGIAYENGYHRTAWLTFSGSSCSTRTYSLCRRTWAGRDCCKYPRPRQAKA